MENSSLRKRLWWERDDLHYRDNILFYDGRNLFRHAVVTDTPFFMYSAKRVKEKLESLHKALSNQGISYKILYAMKANRSIPLLTAIKIFGLCGMDVCSPGETLQALQLDFREEDISFTGVSISDRDLEILKRYPKIVINCGSIRAIRMLAKVCPGRNIGIRVNVGVGIGYNQMLYYAGKKTTKFGIYQDRFEEALEVARREGMVVQGLHFHSGSGYLTPQLPTLERIFDQFNWFLEKCPDIDYVNIGGGLGTPLVEADHPLDLDAWAAVISEKLGSYPFRVIVEPGDFLVRDSGVMTLQVGMVEKKRDVLFIGVDGGFNIHNEPAYYKLPLIIAPIKRRSNPSEESTESYRNYTIAGNINEGLDIFAENVRLPEVREGDYLAFLNAGSYGAALSSNHCMRGHFTEYIFI